MKKAFVGAAVAIGLAACGGHAVVTHTVTQAATTSTTTTQAATPSPDVLTACPNTVTTYVATIRSTSNYFQGSGTAGQLANDESNLASNLLLLDDQARSIGLSDHGQVFGQAAGWATASASIVQTGGDPRNVGAAPAALRLALQTDCATSWAQDGLSP